MTRTNAGFAPGKASGAGKVGKRQRFSVKAQASLLTKNTRDSDKGFSGAVVGSAVGRQVDCRCR